MQTRKDIVRKHILEAAQSLFLQRDYISVSMREIASEAKVGVGNIYHYFKNKDDIFVSLVKPAIDMLKHISKEHHRRETDDIRILATTNYYECLVDSHLANIIKNRDCYKLLFLKSQGSSYGDFKRIFTEEMMLEAKGYFTQIKENNPNKGIDISEQFIRFSVISMITLIEHLTIYDMTKEKRRKVLQEYTQFEIAGWRELLKI